jgi:hypothetical protein
MKLFLTFALMLINFSTAKAESVDFYRSLVLISKDQKKEAYNILEGVFEKTDDLKEKGKAAFLLSYASNSELKKHKRHFYSERSLQIHSEIGESQSYLTKKQENSLRRISGDGYFDEGKFELALQNYNALMQEGSNQDQEYAQYKTAWVYLNKGKNQLAFETLFNLYTKKNSTREFSDAVLKDLGRVFSEDGKNLEVNSIKLFSLQLSELETKKVAEGLVKGIKRLNSSEDKEVFRKILLGSSFYNSIFEKMIEQNTGISSKDCTVLNWTQPMKESSVAFSQVAPYLRACLVLNPAHTQNEQFKSNFYHALKLFKPTENEIWMRADLLHSIGLNDEACTDYIRLGIQSTEQVDKELVNSLTEVCSDVKDTKVIASQWMQLLKKLSQSNKSSLLEDIKSPIYTLTAKFLKSDEKFKNDLKSSLLTEEDHKVWSKTKFYLLYTDIFNQFSLAEKQRFVQFYSKLDFTNLNSGDSRYWSQILLSTAHELYKSENKSALESLIQKYFSITSSSWLRTNVNYISKFWTYLFLIKNQDASTIQTFFSKVLNLGVLETIENEELEKMVAILVQTQIQDTLILDAFESKVRNSNINRQLKETFLAKYFDRSLKENKIGSNPCLAELANFYTNSKSDGLQKISVICSSLNAPNQVLSEISDLKMVSDKKFFNSNLRLNSKLTTSIEDRFSKIKNTLDSIEQKKWSSQKMKNQALQALLNQCDVFSNDLKRIPRPKILGKDQIDQLEATFSGVQQILDQWKIQVKERVVL